MSDVLFRGPIDLRHADDVDYRLHCAWRRLRATVLDPQEFSSRTADFRISAVRVAMMLETARPPEAAQIDGHFELPDARTLACLLAMRCERDGEEELLEMYRLVCQKLTGLVCAWCTQPFDECNSAGSFEGEDSLVIPATIPKLFVPQCGHAIHTLCFGSQLVPERQQAGLRGCCRRCSLPYGWTAIDVDPMVNAFCLLFGPYVDKRAVEMQVAGEMLQGAVLAIAEVCNSFSQELGGLVSAASAWILLVRRHAFEAPETVEAIGEAVLRLLAPPQEEDADGGQVAPLLPTGGTAVICPEDRSDDEDACSRASGCSALSAGALERGRHVTEVFLADPCSDPEPEPQPHCPGCKDCSPHLAQVAQDGLTSP